MSFKINTLLLDMNDTFMFDGDRFGKQVDYSKYYMQSGGSLDSDYVNTLINDVYEYLLLRYPDPSYRESFPKVKDVVKEMTAYKSLSGNEIAYLTDTFSYHELGSVNVQYAQAISKLSGMYKIGLVADIWSEKGPWIKEFNRAGILDSFDFLSFSSDSGIVKPSPKPFVNALKELEAKPEHTLVVGDSPRRDLGGAMAAGINCVLVGDKTHKDAYREFNDFLEFTQFIETL